MKKITFTIILTLVSLLGYAQSLTVSASASDSGNRYNQFSIAGHQVTIENDQANFSGGVGFDINARTALSASIQPKAVTLYAGNGSKLNSPSYNLVADDASAKVYVGANGKFIIRENIANFLFYDASGRISQTVSNSSQSKEGEAVSELAADPMQKTVVLYNPKIVRNGVEGSKASIVNANWTKKDIFYSSERAIRTIKVSDNGQYIAIVTYKSGTEDIVEITDRYGNDIANFSFNQDVQDVKFTENAEFVTIMSSSRVGVYSLLDGEREGSTSFRSTLYFAQYVPEDDAIIAMTADEQSGRLTEVEFHAINLAERKIERQEYNSSLGITELLPVTLKRVGADRYTLNGLSNTLEVRASY